MTVNAIPDSEVLGSDCNGDVLTLIDGACSGHSGNKYYAVDTFADLDAVDGCANVKIRVFTVCDAHFLS